MKWNLRRLRPRPPGYNLNIATECEKTPQTSNVSNLNRCINSTQAPKRSKTSYSYTTTNLKKKTKKQTQRKLQNKRQQLINKNSEKDTSNTKTIEEEILSPLPILTKTTLSKTITEISEKLIMNDEVEQMLIEMTENFVNSVIHGSSIIAKHRKGRNIEIKDVKLYLSFCNNQLYYPANQKYTITNKHKERLNFIKKFLKQRI